MRLPSTLVEGLNEPLVCLCGWSRKHWSSHNQHHRHHHQGYRHQHHDALHFVRYLLTIPRVAGCATGSVRPFGHPSLWDEDLYLYPTIAL